MFAQEIYISECRTPRKQERKIHPAQHHCGCKISTILWQVNLCTDCLVLVAVTECLVIVVKYQDSALPFRGCTLIMPSLRGGTVGQHIAPISSKGTTT